VQNNAEVSKALESARQRAQEAMSAMNSDKLLTTVASYTEVAKQATGAALSQVDAALTSVDKLIELVDPSNQDDLFDEEDYDPVLAVGKVKVIVTSAHPAHVAAVVDVFESVHGVDSVFAKGSPTDSAIAKQPVGFEAGLKGAQVTTHTLRSVIIFFFLLSTGARREPPPVHAKAQGGELFGRGHRVVHCQDRRDLV